MMLNIRHFLLFLFFFFVSALCYGQDEAKNMELKKILEDIAQQHSVKFSYIENDIKGHRLPPPDKQLPLKAKLVYIENRTGLNHKETGNNYIIIYRDIKFHEEKICGFLLDENMLPLEKASITYGDFQTAQTGADGYFEFEKKPGAKVSISYVGFRTATYSPESFTKDCKKIILTSDAQLLDEVVAERYLTTGISKLKDGTFVIKPKKFGILPGLIEPDVLLTMQQLPGINSIDETVSNINVRGGTHDQNLFMWNGIRLFQTGHFFGLISALNPNPAYDIKISKNGTSAFYGESVSSAIDISSRSETIDEDRTSIGSNMINTDFYTRIKTSENANLELSARRSFTDVIDLPTYSKYSKRIFQNTVVTQLNNSADVYYKSDKEFYFYDFTGQYHQKIRDKHNVYINVIGIKNKLDFTEGTVTSTNVVTRSSRLSQLTLGGNAAWQARWNDTNSSEISLYTTHYALDANNASLESDEEIAQKNSINDSGLRVSNTNQISPLINLHTGYQLNEISIENTEVLNVAYTGTLKRVLRTHAFIAEADYNSADGKLFSKIGIRANYINKFRRAYPEPRMQLNYTVDERWNIEVLGELKSQSASQIVEFQDDFLGIEKRRWVLADDDNIPVQKSAQASAGITFRDKGWLVSLEHFYKKVDGITTSGQAFQDQLETVAATGQYTVQGTEFLVQKQFRDFYAWLSYTWNTNSYEFPDFSPYKFPNNLDINHTINSAVIYELYNFKIALGSKWFTGRPVTTPIGNQTINFSGNPEILYSFPNADNIENFFQFNFSASYLLKLTEKVNLQFGISVLNLFNKQNIINRYYRINAGTNAIEVVNTYSVERTPNALVKLSF
jgi:hypothetical protein